MIRRLLITAIASTLLSLASPIPARAETASGEYTFEFNDEPNHLWDISGDYSEEVDTLDTDYTILMDPSGKFVGQGTASDYDTDYSLSAGFSFVGSLKSAGNVTRVTMNWKMNGTIQGDGIVGTFKATMKQNLEIDSADHEMIGTMSGKITVAIPGEGKQSAKFGPAESSTDLPGDMIGSWTLALNITALGNKYSGQALVRLSNEREFPLDLTGSYSTKTGRSKLSLKGQGVNRALNIKLNSTVNAGQMNLETMSARLLGQKLAMPGSY